MNAEERVDKAATIENPKDRALIIDMVQQAEAAASMYTLQEVLLIVNGIEESAEYKNTFWSGILYARARIAALLNESYKGDVTQPKIEVKSGFYPSIVWVDGGKGSRDYFRAYDPLIDNDADE